MTVGVGGTGWERLWLDREPTKNCRGHYEFAGDCGLDQIIVEIDPSIIRGLSDVESAQRLSTMHHQLQEAARRKYRDSEAYEFYPEPNKRMLRIALASEDVAG
jgi:hypothetical protein